MSKKKLEQAFYHALEQVEVAKSRILALHYALYPLRSKERLGGNALDEFSALHDILYDQLNDAFRMISSISYSLLLFGSLVDSKKHQQARVAAARHYLDEKSSIMHYLGIDGSYSSLDEDMFREEIKQALGEQS